MNDKPHAKPYANPCKNKPKTSPQHLKPQPAQPTLENRKQHGDTTLTSLGVYGSWLRGFRISRIPASHYSIPTCPVSWGTQGQPLGLYRESSAPKGLRPTCSTMKYGIGALIIRAGFWGPLYYG